MPQSTLLPGATHQLTPHSPPQPNPRGLKTFTGAVTIDPVHTHTPSPSIAADFKSSLTMVTFAPGARTYWHWHEKGQLLNVTKGRGWVCDKGAEPRRIRAGDVVWCPPGVTHWHGADADGGEGEGMMHLAFSMGEVEWFDAVDDGGDGAGKAV